jgi:anaerobic magnesium-protoporphyrin IX monomethyl ester cyclase
MLGNNMSRTPKVLLINPPSDCVDDDRVEPPLGLLYLASTLAENGFQDVNIIDMTGCKDESEVTGKINAVPQADIYGITCFCTNYQFARRIALNIRHISPSALIVFGGPNSSALPDFTLQDSGCDVVVIGEGEDALLNCVRKFSRGLSVKGTLYGRGREDINSYAFPARYLVDLSTYSRKLMGHTVVSLISSRGCIHHCIYCNSVVMGGGSKNPRYRSPGNIIDEIKSLRGSFAHYRFNDDYFTGNPNLEELLLRMRQLGIDFRVFAKLEDLDIKICGLLKSAGCVHVSIGLESLNPDNLRIIGKSEQIGKEQHIRIAKENGLIVRASFMVGLPYDSDRTIDHYFREAAQIGIDEFAIYPLIPYPGTALAKSPERFGYEIINTDFTQYIQMGKSRKTCYALRHKNFSPEDVQRWLNTATEILEINGTVHMSHSEIAT